MLTRGIIDGVLASAPLRGPMRIFATRCRDGVREEITDLYWFEEQGVRTFGDPEYIFEFEFALTVVGTHLDPS